jgi:hypothetical protein
VKSCVTALKIDQNVRIIQIYIESHNSRSAQI